MIMRRGVGATTDSFPYTVKAPSSASDLTWNPPPTSASWFVANQDAPLSCQDLISSGVDVSGTDCAPTSGLPSWAIPAGLAALGFLLVMGMTRR